MRTLLRLPALVLAAVAVACAPSESSTPDPDKPVEKCGDVVCKDDERCLERASEPGVPACVALNDCTARPPGRDLVAEALDAIGRDRCTLTAPKGFLAPQTPADVRRDPFRLPHLDELMNEPLRVPGWSEQLVASFGHPAEDTATSHAIRRAAALFGITLEDSTVESPAGDSPLVDAMRELAEAHGGTLRLDTWHADAIDVPLAAQRPVAAILRAVSRAALVRQQAFKDVPNTELFHLCAASYTLPVPYDCSGVSLGKPEIRKLLAEKIDWRALYQAAYDIARTVESVDLAAAKGRTGFDFDQRTAIGRVVITDGGEQTIEAGISVALLVDFGGDDTYRYEAGANSSATHPVAVHVDVGGNDTYGYTPVASPHDEGRLPSDALGRYTPSDPAQGATAASRSMTSRQGTGRLGIGMLFDMEGDDTYRSLRMSQGYAAFGVGVLSDRAGDDLYVAEAGAQGSAAFGIGLLVDGRGKDEYRIHTQGQGYAYVGAVAALLDGDGDDVYFADPGAPSEGGDPLYYTPQKPGEANSSFAQGAAQGRRPPPSEVQEQQSWGGSLSGGLGLLADLAGNDTYTASIFGQATGYWFGTGLLHDESGDDTYDGKWYVRGSSAHFALAAFRDREGNDRHGTGNIAMLSTSYAVGHDFSIGWLVDDQGDDIYRAPPLSLGAGNACGWGFLFDGDGDDVYEAPARSMGHAGDPLACSFGQDDPKNVTIGMLVDAGGTDTYTLGGETLPRENKVTLAAPVVGAPEAKGVTLDGEGAILALP